MDNLIFDIVIAVVMLAAIVCLYISRRNILILKDQNQSGKVTDFESKIKRQTGFVIASYVVLIVCIILISISIGKLMMQ